MKSFPLRNLGRSAVQLPVVGVGGAPLGDLHEIISEEQADATVRTAFDSGLRYFDTAPWYGTGKSEHRVGRILRTVPRDSFILSTKAGRCLERPRDLAAYRPSRWVGGLPFEVRFDYTYSGMMRAYEDSLARLGLNRVDLLLIHDIDTNHHATREAVAARFVELVDGGGLRALEELKRSGEIKAFGAGVNLRGTIRDCLDRFDLDFFLVAGPYTLLDQAVLDDEWPMLESRGCGVILGSVFASGILAAPEGKDAPYLTRPAPPHIREKLQAIRDVAKRHGVSPAAAAIQFGLANPRVTAIVPGVNHPDQVTMNLELLAAPIPADFWQELRAEKLLHADAPVPTAAPC